VTALEPTRQRRKGFYKWSDSGLSSYLMLAPFVLLFVAFSIYPIFASFRLSFMRYNAICDEELSPCGSVRFGNSYRLFFADARFHKALLNTSYYVVGAVSLTIIASLMLAIALQADTKSNCILRVVFFLPSVTSSIVPVLVWCWVFRGAGFGLLNGVLSALGISPVDWLATPALAFPILVLMSVWGGAVYGMILFLAGINSIPTYYYEAAMIDGANPRQRFRYITLPLLKPLMTYVGITSIIGAFQIFAGVYLLFPTSVGSVGGLQDMALMLVPYLYDQGFIHFRLGYASAIAWVLFGIIFIISLINLKLSKSFEDLR